MSRSASSETLTGTALSVRHQAGLGRRDNFLWGPRADPAFPAFLGQPIKFVVPLPPLLLFADEIAHIVRCAGVVAGRDLLLHPLLEGVGERNVHRGHGNLLSLIMAKFGKNCHQLTPA